MKLVKVLPSGLLAVSSISVDRKSFRNICFPRMNRITLPCHSLITIAPVLPPTPSASSHIRRPPVANTVKNPRSFVMASWTDHVRRVFVLNVFAPTQSNMVVLQNGYEIHHTSWWMLPNTLRLRTISLAFPIPGTCDLLPTTDDLSKQVIFSFYTQPHTSEQVIQQVKDEVGNLSSTQ